MTQPFWERTYSNPDAAGAFGSPAEELQRLVSFLPQKATVLDLGCGEGRNALFLAEDGCRVTAFDISKAGIAKLRQRAQEKSLSIRAHVADLCQVTFSGAYDLIIAHGVLHLLEPACRDRLIEQMQAHTRRDGYNVAVAFRDAPPEDLEPFMIGLFEERELFRFYDDWHIFEQSSYVLEDEHPGGIRHRHPINKIVARRPSV